MRLLRGHNATEHLLWLSDYFRKSKTRLKRYPTWIWECRPVNRANGLRIARKVWRAIGSITGAVPGKMTQGWTSARMRLITSSLNLCDRLIQNAGIRPLRARVVT